MKKKKVGRKTPRLNERDRNLIQRFLENYRTDFLTAYLKAREAHRQAPDLSGLVGAMEYRKNGISCIDYMISHLPHKQLFLEEFADYQPERTVS